MNGFLTPVTLQGPRVRLEPLTPAHSDGLVLAAADGELWKLWYTSVPVTAEMPAYVAAFLERQQKGEAQAFAVRDLASGDIVGHTSFCNADGHHRRLEIGYTWYAQSAQRTGINTETKSLLLAHAFETLACIRVEFRTHWFNQRSRAAIVRLGARQDGVLRNHQIMPDGTLRDTVVFSIIDTEWPAVKRHLQFLMESRS